ncbi:hypothetical protein Acr_00g0003260 [Actinidia rufa]|uniref:Uncharacterized protein n=1 Tax=Actinidia rufa TaxID=165716 RepID=A0A7J0D6E3_9ERIC|nr:hypothetical protein Acr_00g0000900 [Actinidia rufa]GFS28682.1 hypothetical protein Acr_00g0003260 [Actinidia rufa]
MRNSVFPPLRPYIFFNPWQPPTLGREWLLHAKEDKEGSVLTLIVRLSKSAGIHLLLGRASIVYRDLQICIISPSSIVVDPTISCMWGCPGRRREVLKSIRRSYKSGWGSDQSVTIRVRFSGEA